MKCKNCMCCEYLDTCIDDGKYPDKFLGGTYCHYHKKSIKDNDVSCSKYHKKTKIPLTIMWNCHCDYCNKIRCKRKHKFLSIKKRMQIE